MLNDETYRRVVAERCAANPNNLSLAQIDALLADLPVSITDRDDFIVWLSEQTRLPGAAAKILSRRQP